MSQAKLAGKAGVSLATLQNVEAGRANPELSTLESLLKALGLRLVVQPQAIDWRRLEPLGIPLMSSVGLSPEARADAFNLLNAINSQAAHIGALAADTREAKALGSWLWAIRDHYPRVWQNVDPVIRDWFSSMPPSQLSIKLRRISLEGLKGL